MVPRVRFDKPGKIAQVGRVEVNKADEVNDAKDLIVSPGMRARRDIRDNSTWERPRVYPSCISKVLMNGGLVIAGMNTTEYLLGK